MSSARPIIAVEGIEANICALRGYRVMLSSELARLYGVETKMLVRAVKRNRDRFPVDFMFQLSKEEYDDLKCQIGTSSWGGARRALPYAFTEQGVAMLSSVLRSRRAVRVNIEIMRAFVRFRGALATNSALTRRLNDLEKRVGDHDGQFVAVIRAIRELMQPPPAPKKRRIGFLPAPEESAT